MWCKLQLVWLSMQALNTNQGHTLRIKQDTSVTRHIWPPPLRQRDRLPASLQDPWWRQSRWDGWDGCFGSAALYFLRLSKPTSVCEESVFFFLLTIRSQGSWRNPYGIPTDPWQLNSLLPSSTKNLPAMGATSLHPVVNMVSTSWGSPAIAVARAAGHPAVHGWCPESIADSDVESVEHPGRISSHQFQYTIQRKLWLLIQKPPAGDVASLQKASNMTAVM